MMEEARQTTAEAFTVLKRTATPEQLVVLNALHKYVDNLHDMIENRNA